MDPKIGVMTVRRFNTAFVLISADSQLIIICLGLFCGLAPTFAKGQVSVEHQESPLKPYVDTDAYRVYAVLLDNAKYSPFTVQSETESFAEATSKNIGVKGDRKFRKVWGAAVKDLARKYHQQLHLANDIPIDARYDVIPKRELMRRYEPGTGYYSFSPVGFNPAKTRAIVEMIYKCFGWCAHGTLHFLEKVNGRWREVSVNADVEVLDF
jgi:hypothetical protein